MRYKNLTKLFSLFVYALLGLGYDSIYAQDDLGSWNILNIRYKYDDKLSFFAEAQLRSLSLYDRFHYYEVKSGVSYSLNSNIIASLGVGTYQTYGSEGNFQIPKNNDEFRLWPQIVFTHPAGFLQMEHRYRLEMRWTSRGYRNRYRLRSGFTYDFGKMSQGYKPFRGIINTELFFTDEEPYFERLRFQLAGAYRLNSKLSFQLGWIHQFDYRIFDETGMDFLMFGVYFDFLKSSSRLPDDF
ncbi:MAG: DUF2490 domain-containing protein [Chitinophagales bacterium]|jgi:hypothetical protein|nr:DUF2490 domain-containing protein [Chitinophagales bacterium]